MTSPQNADAILMLDDEFDIMSIFTLALEQQGFHVIGFTEPLLWRWTISRKILTSTG
jgi:hypothetical protein